MTDRPEETERGLKNERDIQRKLKTLVDTGYKSAGTARGRN